MLNYDDEKTVCGSLSKVFSATVWSPEGAMT